MMTQKPICSPSTGHALVILYVYISLLLTLDWIFQLERGRLKVKKSVLEIVCHRECVNKQLSIRSLVHLNIFTFRPNMIIMLCTFHFKDN